MGYLTLVDPTTALRRIKTGKNYEYVFSCDTCKAEIRRRPDVLKKLKTPGKCRACANERNWRRTQLRPYEWLLNDMTRKCAEVHIDFRLTYEDIVYFTQSPSCTYCGDAVQWMPYRKFGTTSRSSNLDRLDVNVGYLRENCVVACWDCNRIRGSFYSPDEMKQIGKLTSAIRRERPRAYPFNKPKGTRNGPTRKTRALNLQSVA